MSEIITVGLDHAKNVFQVHGADSAGGAVLRKKIRRAQVLAFFYQLPPCVVAMEACGGAHYWGREIGKLGHEVRLIPPAYVKPFVKRQKNDAADAEPIADHRRQQCHHQAARPCCGATGHLAGRDADAQATDAGAGGAGEQDGAHRLGLDGQGRRLPGSGRGGISLL